MKNKKQIIKTQINKIKMNKWKKKKLMNLKMKMNQVQKLIKIKYTYIITRTEK